MYCAICIIVGILSKEYGLQESVKFYLKAFNINHLDIMVRLLRTGQDDMVKSVKEVDIHKENGQLQIIRKYWA